MEALLKLKKDIKNASVNLSDEEARYESDLMIVTNSNSEPYIMTVTTQQNELRNWIATHFLNEPHPLIVTG